MTGGGLQLFSEILAVYSFHIILKWCCQLYEIQNWHTESNMNTKADWNIKTCFVLFVCTWLLIGKWQNRIDIFLFRDLISSESEGSRWCWRLLSGALSPSSLSLMINWEAGLCEESDRGGNTAQPSCRRISTTGEWIAQRPRSHSQQVGSTN